MSAPTTVLLPDGSVLCSCGWLHQSAAQAARCEGPAHRPRWHKKLATLLAFLLCLALFGALLGAFLAVISEPRSGYQIPDSGYPFQSGAP